MTKVLLATTCLALASTMAMAADLAPMQTKAPMMNSAFSWTGCYVGAHVGGGTLSTNGTGLNPDEGFPSTVSGNSSNGSGAIGGGQLGCNYQDGNWVFGLEGEGFWSGIKASQHLVFSDLNDSDGVSMKNSNDFTFAARAGITFDRTLIYAKGGWAWGNYQVDGNEICCGTIPRIVTQSQSGYLNGFLFGAGIEHALTRNWTVKLEYDYIGYGTKDLAQTACINNVCSPNGSFSVNSTKQLFKVGVNYLFDVGGAPLLAKY